ncbi:MAG: dUTP diphosphatase [Chloroflexota bacterium]
MRIPIARIDPALPLPAYSTVGAVGMDLLCRTGATIGPGETGRIPANVIVAVPKGYVLLIALRSGTPKRTGLISPGGIGIIDNDYCGPQDELQIQVFNPTDHEVQVQRGDRIAQAILQPVSTVEWDETAPVSDVSRGGFGSTG